MISCSFPHLFELCHICRRIYLNFYIANLSWSCPVLVTPSLCINPISVPLFHSNFISLSPPFNSLYLSSSLLLSSLCILWFPLPCTSLLSLAFQFSSLEITKAIMRQDDIQLKNRGLISKIDPLCQLR